MPHLFIIGIYNDRLTRLEVNRMAMRVNGRFLYYHLYKFFYVKGPFIKMYFTSFKARYIKEAVDHICHLVHLCTRFVDDIGSKSIPILLCFHSEHLHIRFNG